jgi:hypothetical protein
MVIVLRAASLVSFLLPCIVLTTAFCPITRRQESARSANIQTERNRWHHHRQQQPLYSGKGIAPSYTWQEEAFDIEIIVKVPKETRAKDVHFKVKPNSLDLRLNASPPGDDDDEESSEVVVVEERILLDSSRKLRGRIVLDGTYWIISDPDPDDKDDGNDESHDEYREVTVTIEKQIRTPKDEFDIIEYDWNGVYEDDEEEVTYRKYDVPEELNVRDYAASMGVDIDNIDMNLVDKSMFTSGLNVTKSTLDNMKEAGLMTEVTQQKDGSEWITGEDGEQKPFSTMGRGISKDEAPKIPFLDTDSPWQKKPPVPVDRVKDVTKRVKNEKTTAASSSQDPTITKKSKNDDDVDDQKEEDKAAKDPVDNLTVAKLREVLKARGLKVSGNKKELQERLRSEIQSMLSNDEVF